MSNLRKTVGASALLALGLAFASAVSAEQSPSGEAGKSRAGPAMRDGGMMGEPGAMMGQMGGMMDGCNGMMQGRNQPPNSQFRRPSQPSPEE